MNTKRVLFISEKFTNGTGGFICSNRNYNSLKEIFGDENVFKYEIEYPKHSKQKLIKRIINKIKAEDSLTPKNINSIKKILKEHKIEEIWIDRSTLGYLAPILKRFNPHLHITVFFHNFELEYFRGRFKNNSINKFLLEYKVKRNELFALKYSDKSVCLNECEAKRISIQYKIKPSEIIPISLIDGFNKVIGEAYSKPGPHKIKNLLFIGSYFFGNVEGIKWFCEKILPFTDCNLTIIGKGMNQLSQTLKITDKISIYDFVDNLNPYYEKADSVIFPIISGAGMKVKVAEALMHGKFLIGTSLAFEGYDISPDNAIICDDPQEFIKALNMTEAIPYNIFSRNLFLNKYSFDATLPLFKKLFIKE